MILVLLDLRSPPCFVILSIFSSYYIAYNIEIFNTRVILQGLK